MQVTLVLRLDWQSIQAACILRVCIPSRGDYRGRCESESAGISSFCVLQSDYSSDECVRLAASRHGYMDDFLIKVRIEALIFNQPSIYIDGWLYGMRMTSVVCNVPVLSQNDSTYHSVFTT